MNNNQAFIFGRHIPDDKRIGGVYQGDALEINMGMGELRDNIVHIVVHAINDGLHYRFL